MVKIIEHLAAASLLGYAAALEAPNPDHEYYCPYPDEKFPGSGWLNISARAEQAEYIIYAKAITKLNAVHDIFGSTYDVEWSLDCQPMKKPDGSGVFPQTFKMTGLGRFGPNYIPCGPRNIVTGFNYVFFAKSFDAATGYIELDEVNNQEGLFRLSEDNDARIQLADWMYGCVANHCHDDSEGSSADWAPMSFEDRAKAAEYSLEVHMTTETQGCIQCVIRQPDEEGSIEHVYGANETITINMEDGSMACHNYNVLPGKRYVMLLQRSDINDVVLPNGQLMVDEVNGEVAILEVDNQVQSELADLLRTCPAQDYECPVESSGSTRWVYGSLVAATVCLISL